MVLGKLPVPGRPTIWILVGQGPIALAIGAGGGCLDIFALICPFSPLFSLSFGDGPILTEILSQRAVKPKNQPTNQKQAAKNMKVENWKYVLAGGGRVVRWSWVNFQCRGVLPFG